jgi:hypothetical protein
LMRCFLIVSDVPCTFMKELKDMVSWFHGRMAALPTGNRYTTLTRAAYLCAS